MKSLFGRFRYNRLASSFTIIAVLSAGIIIGSVVAHGVHGQAVTSTPKVDTSDATPLQVPPAADLSNQFSKIVKEVGPAVVNISTIELPKTRPNSGNSSPYFYEGPNNNFQQFFRRFFGGGPGMGGQGGQQSQERESLGSGYIVSPKGYIITNYHVIKGADKIWVRLSTDPDNGFMEGRPATVVGYDQATDIAVLKIKTDKPLPTVKMGNSEGMQVGDWVVAIGSPFALSHTVTAGVISAKDRTINPGTKGEFQHFLQTDAAINPGNSGGPLVNMDGQVIGMNTAIYTDTGSYAGIGFALPSNLIIHIYNQLISPTHKVVRGSIGISFQEHLPTAVQRVYGITHGVLISSVQSGFPAEKAGLKAGDVITSIDGQPVKDGNDLVNMISARAPGTTVKIGYSRNGKAATTDVTIANRTKMLAALENGQKSGSGTPGSPNTENAQAKLGISVSDLPQGAPAGLHGVLIQSVKPGSFADQIGLAAGEVIVAINRHQVNNVNDFRTIVAGLRSGDDVAFEVVDAQDPSAGFGYRGGQLP